MLEALSPIKPAETALLVMDFQPSITERLADADELLMRVETAIAAAREHEVTVAYVRVAFTDSDLAGVPSTNKSFSQLAKTGLKADEPRNQVHPRLAPRPGDIEVRKVRVGAFSTTDLDEQLRSKGIKNIILAGVSTSGVVLSTTREAADKDYRIFIMRDGVADFDTEVHRVLLEKVFPRQAYIIDADGLSSLFK